MVDTEMSENPTATAIFQLQIQAAVTHDTSKI
jgi:hypothetical protein